MSTDDVPFAGTSGSIPGTRFAVGILVAVLVTMLLPAGAGAQDVGDGTEDAMLRLARRHAPVVVVKAQDGPCDDRGEPFEPAPVEIVLDNPEVFLRQVGNDDPVAMRGPGAADLFDLREGWYLDFPGDALDPGCVFEQDFRRFHDGRSVVYAHVAREAGRPGYLALQYWMFWYHNPAKNDHEGDWEFVQLLFEADTAAEALRDGPVAVGYAQHTGGERAGWDDGKLERQGDRPVVYAARGSHAGYFGSALYLGRSGREGFGCDNTDGPSRALDPEVVMLPASAEDPSDPFAWLSFQGRWGQREPGFFNGPTGPFAKDRWDRPVTWHEGLRSSSVVIPGGDRFGDGVLNTFCGSVEVGSTFVATTLRSPVLALVVGLALVTIAVAAVRATRWSPVRAHPLRADRAVGQILRSAARIWREEPRAMLTIGLVYVPVAIVTAALQTAILAIPWLDDLLGLAGDRSGVAFVLAIMVGGIADLLAFVYASAAVARIVDRDGPGHDAHRSLPSREELRLLVWAVARSAVIVVALFVSLVGVPWGIRQLVRYQFVPQVVALERASPGGALARSSHLVRGRWWWTAGVVVSIEAVVAFVGFGAAIAVLLIVRDLPLWAFNVVGSSIYLVLVPVGAAAVTYAYGAACARTAANDEDAVEPLTESGALTTDRT